MKVDIETDPPTSKGNQFDQRAHERIIKRNPTARKNDKNITAEKF
jgi:hypothetical protein